MRVSPLLVEFAEYGLRVTLDERGSENYDPAAQHLSDATRSSAGAYGVIAEAGRCGPGGTFAL